MAGRGRGGGGAPTDRGGDEAGAVASRISTDEIGMREGNILDWAGGKRCRVTKFLPPKLLNEIKIALFLKRNGTT